MKNGPIVYESGSKYWYKNDKQHREDGPAVEHVNGCKEWWYKGFFVGKGDHPDPALWERLTSVEINGGPLLNGCVVGLSNSKQWFKDDLLHREDGPATEFSSGYQQWYLEGVHFGVGSNGFWNLWDQLTDKQRANPNLLRYLPR